MQKIKEIQQGSIEDNMIYYCIPYTAGHIANKDKMNYVVDEICKKKYDLHIDYNNKAVVKAFVYQGYKNGKLVFEMFNPDLITYDTE